MARVLLFFEIALIVDGLKAWDHVVTLYERNGTNYKIVRRCAAAPAAFGSRFDDEMIACPVFPHPKDGCSKIEPPPRFVNSSERYLCVNYVALLERGACTYANKVFLGQEAGYQAVIVYDNEIDDGPTAMGKDGVYDNRINIPSVFITRSCGLFIQNYSKEIGSALLISRFPVDFTQYLMPFVVVMGGCLFLAVVALGVKYVRDKRQEWRRRLSRRKLKRLPTKKYKKAKNEESPETCPICLEDFDDGDRLRILPCNHWYHLKCVDPWLTKNRKICPVCKRKVLKDDSDSSSSSSSDDDERRPSSTTRALLPGTSNAATVDETSPLLTPREPDFPATADANRSATPTANYGSTNESFLTASESTTSTNDDNDSLDGLTFADVATTTTTTATVAVVGNDVGVVNETFVDDNDDRATDRNVRI